MGKITLVLSYSYLLGIQLLINIASLYHGMMGGHLLVSSLIFTPLIIPQLITAAFLSYAQIKTNLMLSNSCLFYYKMAHWCQHPYGTMGRYVSNIHTSRSLIIPQLITATFLSCTQIKTNLMLSNSCLFHYKMAH